ncbi:hypothetical protein EYR36_005550 [Pleurotus pulmonarius]|nr:hypothetical protein EYR36_005550 [Pleurotus pulmonarius]
MHVERLMDWQRTAILPLFLHVGMPSAIQLERDQLPRTHGIPEPAIGFERLKQAFKEIHHETCKYPLSVLRTLILRRACELREGESIKLLCELTDTANGWEDLLSFALMDDEREPAAELYQKLSNMGDRETMLASLVV